MRFLGFSSDYVVYGLLMTAWLLVCYTDHFTAGVEVDQPPVYHLNGACSTPQRGKLPPPDQLTLPIYPGCEDRADYEERFSCGAERFYDFINSNKRDPAGSRKEMVVLEITIGGVSGRMEEVKVHRAVDQRNQREALRVVNMLVERDVRWTPGTRKGEASSFRLGIGIPFHGAGCGD
ncbi:hypothetical protein [Lewinella sp. IMCC34191]|uniref:hypothetical protein n=1 Tax=Lewinella sp. IMCC34191 TaxID=2259172 RepID=UPI000E23C4B7|nr:hypothetical protein [Lewinella sp. IMCC34191]